MVDLFKLAVGDYVAFRSGGFAKVTGIDEQIDPEDYEDCGDDTTHELFFDGVTEGEGFGRDGKFYPWGNKTSVLDIIDVVPASVLERKLKEQKEANDDIF